MAFTSALGRRKNDRCVVRRVTKQVAPGTTRRGEVMKPREHGGGQDHLPQISGDRAPAEWRRRSVPGDGEAIAVDRPDVGTVRPSGSPTQVDGSLPERGACNGVFVELVRREMEVRSQRLFIVGRASHTPRGSAFAVAREPRSRWGSNGGTKSYRGRRASSASSSATRRSAAARPSASLRARAIDASSNVGTSSRPSASRAKRNPTG